MSQSPFVYVINEEMKGVTPVMVIIMFIGALLLFIPFDDGGAAADRARKKQRLIDDPVVLTKEQCDSEIILSGYDPEIIPKLPEKVRQNKCYMAPEHMPYHFNDYRNPNYTAPRPGDPLRPEDFKDPEDVDLKLPRLFR